MTLPWVRMEILEHTLKISLTDDGLAEVKENPDITLEELLEQPLCNGWEFVRPEVIGALTDSPILSNDTTQDDRGNYTHVGNVWWFPNYQISDPAQFLKDKGFVYFQKGE